MIISLGVTMLVLSSCGWILLSYVVKLLCLDKNKTGCVDIDLPLHVLVFLRHPKYPHAAESKCDNCVGCNYAFLRFLGLFSMAICGLITMLGHK